MTDDERPLLGRREMIAGGLLAGATATAAMTGEAEARPTSIDSPSDRRSEASPVTTTIASATKPRYIYRHCFMFDFTPEGPASNRAWGGYGAYTQGSTSLLWASIEIPPDTLVREIEWYVRNASTSPINALGRIWRAGTGALVTTIADTTIPVGTAITASLSIVGQSTWGPHPTGTKLALSVRTPTDGTVQINGVRVGFSYPGRSPTSARSNRPR